MQLTPGTSLGPYKILGPLGAGGMGEVYRAQHIRLGREVAVKVLPESMAGAPERRSRFEREARVLAALNHPNIATLHGFEECGDHTLLEMELVPGETLDDRIERGPLEPHDAIHIFKQIAEALEAAHEQGIIHRDLKPANVKITPEGRVKVLDFGLAKALETESARSDSAHSPTFTTRTHEGIVFGTAAYMSPEQVRGKPLDRRTDIWSFGCMLFEAVTGKTPFTAETLSDTFAAVLKEEPDWHAFPPAPVGLQRVVRRCLRKDPAERLHDIADARLELEETLNESAALVVPMPGLRPWRISKRRATGAAILGAIAIAAVAATGWWFGRLGQQAPLRARFAVPIPAGFVLEPGPGPSIALAPDGSRLVFLALERGGGTQLFARALEDFEPTPVPGTRGASVPFFSPDGRWIGFYADGALQKVSIDGGAPLRIAEVPPIVSAGWGADGQIIFAIATAPNGLRRVPDGGGTPEELTVPKADQGELQHAFPELLPGGTHVLFSVLTKSGWDPAVLSLEARDWRVVTRASAHSPARYASSGHLVYAQAGGGLVAVPFDPAAGTVTGSAVPLLERLDMVSSGGSGLAVSDSGALAFVPARTELPARTLVIVDRQGRSTPLSGTREPYAHPRFSRDGSRIALAIQSETGTDIWVHDVARGTQSRLTSGGFNRFPVWNPGGREMTFQASVSPGRFSLFSRDLSGSGELRALLGDVPAEAAGVLQAGVAGLLPGTMPRPGSANPHVPVSWSGDGSHLAFTERKPGAQRDIWVLGPEAEPAPFVLTPFDESAPAFSPGGEWLAYVSNESGRNEVYVQPFPGPGPKWVISTDGGTEPAWSHDGKELFYRRGNQMLAVAVQVKPEFSAARPTVLFEGAFDTTDSSRNYDVARDGRFVMVRSSTGDAPQRVYVALNWFEELKARAGGT